MTDTREAVARAILEARYYDPEPEMYGNDAERFHREVSAEAKDDADYEAGRALAALKPGSRFAVDGVEMMVVPASPSPEMIKAGVDHRLSTNIGGENRWTEDTVTLYRAMLRACEEK